jgi:hypothetical protein
MKSNHLSVVMLISGLGAGTAENPEKLLIMIRNAL